MEYNTRKLESLLFKFLQIFSFQAAVFKIKKKKVSHPDTRLTAKIELVQFLSRDDDSSRVREYIHTFVPFRIPKRLSSGRIQSGPRRVSSSL